VAAGFVAGPVSESTIASMPDLIRSPICAINKRAHGAVRLDEHRQIHNLSMADLAQEVPISVNGGIDPEKCTTRFPTVTEALVEIKRLNDAGTPASGVQADVLSAFRNFPVRPRDWPLLGFRHRGKTYLDTRLGFGARSSPAIFQTLTYLLALLLMFLFAVPWARFYLDDLLALCAAGETNDKVAEIVMLVFSLIGLALQPKKWRQGVQLFVYLGFAVDCVKMTVAIPPERLENLKASLNLWQARAHASPKQLAKLLGHLAFVARVVPTGRIFLRRLYRTLAWARANQRPATLGHEARRDIEFWASCVEHFTNECPFSFAFDASAAPDFEFWTDASKSAGGGYFAGEWFHTTFAQLGTNFADMPIFIKELMCVVQAFLLWGPRLKNKFVLAHCDNTNAVFAVRKMRSGAESAWVNHLLRVLALHAAIFQYRYRIDYINTKLNVIADTISRKSLLELTEYFRSIPGAQLHPQAACSPPDLLDQTWEAQWCAAMRQQYKTSATQL